MGYGVADTGRVPVTEDRLSTMKQRVAVIGARGHTGSFVIAELQRRGMRPVPCDRATDLDLAFQDAEAVINCAGPFAATAAPVIEHAIRAGIPYLDVTAEIEVVTDTFASYADASIPIVPAAAFYGGLGDLLAAAAIGDWPAADHLTIAYALSSWRPTLGTRATARVSAQRRNGQRIAFTGHRLQVREGDAPRTEWTFRRPSAPFRSSARSRWPTARLSRRIWTPPRSPPTCRATPSTTCQPRTRQVRSRSTSTAVRPRHSWSRLSHGRGARNAARWPAAGTFTRSRRRWSSRQPFGY